MTIRFFNSGLMILIPLFLLISSNFGYSSKFETPDQLKSAFDQTKEGNDLFNNTHTTANGTRKKVILPSDGLTKYGYGVKKNTKDFTIC